MPQRVIFQLPLTNGSPAIIDNHCKELLANIETYVISTGATGEMSQITAGWKDLKENYTNQYQSEHTGFHNDLKTLRDAVLMSSEYTVLTNLSRVEGLSAHYSPAYIKAELAKSLTQVGVHQVCDRKLDEVKTDLENGWVCSSCGYKLGEKMDLKTEYFLDMVQRGIKEYLEHIRGCDKELRDYVSDTPEASILLGLLSEPADQNSLTALEDEIVREHLALALVDASALKVNVDELLTALKPKLLGFFKGGRKEFEKFVEEALSELLEKKDEAEEQPWKVE